MKKLFLITTLLVTMFATILNAHCEIPCGIYGDEMRFDMIKEHITTIEKSMKMITELSAERDINYNQLVRWVNNKEQHATEIQDIVGQYFLAQRVKPTQKQSEMDKYHIQLQLCHELIVFAMKAKQSTDMAVINKLNETLDKFRKIYFGPEKAHHSH